MIYMIFNETKNDIIENEKASSLLTANIYLWFPVSKNKKYNDRIHLKFVCTVLT